MKTPSHPERRRDPEQPADWSDTLPAWFRSEAFAEDLPEAPTLIVLPPGAPPARTRVARQPAGC